MPLSDQLFADMKTAMKARDKLRLGVLRMARSDLRNRSIDLGRDLEDAEIVSALQSMVKKRNDSAEAFAAGDRPEQAKAELAEAEVLRSYLPAALDDAALQDIVKEVVAETGASSPRDMGMVMKPVLARVQGRADGKRVSALVRQILAG